ncbi:hypothetical protein [Fulvivirga ligni]|uniref:hypothetical protein n=1 Tax=Fulvivirga ligni TaxID=2904246 RepID=UPI001F2B696A|nr:hypothetical protein [Fulvivirga ligni]UII21582.1 hypothetical protein LVD16_27520 [Fulvivirga ligni]UII21636.1 hypothetical protein LVD16_00085 [Fulvivirga ligni]
MEHYRLEFSEEQQWLRMDNYSHDANTKGFITLKERCTDTEYKIFQAFLTRRDGKLLKDSKFNYRNADVLEAIEQLETFLQNLSKYNLSISDK